MTAYLRGLHTQSGPELAALPLAACARELGLDGLALLLTAQDRAPELVQSFGPLAGQLEDRQLTQGQGPSRDAARTGALLLLPDLTNPAGFATTRWPQLPSAVQNPSVQVSAVMRLGWCGSSLRAA
ncbi:hypothetical protein ACFQ7F_00865 [Streptomyces sp. NPDC056486]|uniref:hypothetical protein n=1 Tax=Streptomyces sp. NPDC056486 TaxID=3345835 RepID=UPI00368693E9